MRKLHGKFVKVHKRVEDYNQQMFSYVTKRRVLELVGDGKIQMLARLLKTICMECRKFHQQNGNKIEVCQGSSWSNCPN